MTTALIENTMTGPADADLLDEPRLSEESGAALGVARIVAPVLRDLGYRLVRVTISAQDGTTLQIMAEKPDGMLDVDDCAKISEAVSPVLDVEDPIKQIYRLEISSPGIDRPLMRVSDFRRAVGFEAKIEMNVLTEGRKRFRGMIDVLDESGLSPVLTLTRYDAKPGEPGVLHLPVGNIADGRMVLTDDLIRETLRAAKAAREAAGEIDDDEADEPTPAPAPDKGPGRFAARNAGKQAAKARPILPAGVRAGLKKSNPTGGPRKPL